MTGWLRLALRWTRRGAALLTIVALLATNVLAFTSAAFVGAVSALASAAGLTTVQARRAAARRAVAERVSRRAAQGAARSVGGVATQSLPMLGWGFVLVLTAWEVRDYCATLDDMRALDPGGELDAHSLCGVEPVTAEALRDLVGLPAWLRIPPEDDVAAALDLSPDATAQ